LAGGCLYRASSLQKIQTIYTGIVYTGNSFDIMLTGNAVGAQDAGASSSKIFWPKLVRFGQIWLDLCNITSKFGQK